MTEFWAAVRKSFFAGLVVVVPAAASIAILVALFNWFTNLLLPVSNPTFTHRLVALVIFFVLVTATGWVTRWVIGKRLVMTGESIIARVPLLNRIYAFVKDVSNTIFTGKKSAFQRVVLVEFPRAGCYSLGFVTSETEGEAQAMTQSTVVNVFVPTTPNPTSGFLILAPREQLIPLTMSVADGMKMVISGGAVTPIYLKKLVSAR